MIYNRYQGDPAISLSEGGADMKFIGGQPVMDQGLENAVKISLFTKNGWWGNALESKASKKIGSDYTTQRTIVDVQTINDYHDAASKALEWMKNEKVVNDIEVTITNPSLNQIHSYILVKGFLSVAEFIFLKNGTNWINQATNPAHERF